MMALLSRAGQLVSVVAVGSVIIWAMIFALPGDPAVILAGEDSTREDVEQVRIEMGLDRPKTIQYIDWITSAARGDFGTSFISRQPVWDQIERRLAPTAQLALFALVIGLLIAVPSSVLATWRPKSIGRLVDWAFSIALAVPVFWVGILLILLFSVRLTMLPSVATYTPLWQSPGQAFGAALLPALTFGLFAGGIFGRFLRASLAESAQQDYIRAAKARGMSDLMSLATHGLRNSLIPLITVVSLRAGSLLGGAVLIEVVFTYPGLGRLLIQAVNTRDYLLVQAILLLVIVIFALSSFAADAIYYAADPRVRRTNVGGSKRAVKLVPPSDSGVE